ncbi:MAG TPA: MFS transporter [Gaiellaceae bacterium]|nr:MFS transporter [Gaiellaceae bacterium]
MTRSTHGVRTRSRSSEFRSRRLHPDPCGCDFRLRPRRGTRLSADARRLIAAQGARAVAYGLGSVLIGVELARRGLSNAAVGAVLASLLGGIALVSVLVGRYGDRVGRRRFYRLLLVLMALAGSVFAATAWLPALIVAGLTGTVSTDVVESGPFTSLEQAMLPRTVEGGDPTRLFGTYNTVATLAGSLGALVALVGSSATWLFAYPVAAGAALLLTARLSSAVELGRGLEDKPRPPLHRSRGIVLRLSGLFALDSFGGGFVPQAFIAYLFTRKYGASPHTLALVFFAIGILQAMSFQAAVRIAAKIGLLRAMVFTHLPSNLLLAAVAFAPNLPTAIVLLLARFLLSQADVPTRQAYVVAVVDPSERTAAAAYTNTARYLTRPAAPLLAGVALSGALGAPFVIAGTLKSAYDIGLYVLFRRVPLATTGSDKRTGD